MMIGRVTCGHRHFALAIRILDGIQPFLDGDTPALVKQLNKSHSFNKAQPRYYKLVS